MADAYGDEETPWRDYDVLWQLSVEQRLTDAAIAEELGCTPATVQRWWGRHEIAQEDREPWRDGDRLRRLYVHDGLSKEDIAARWDCSEMTVYRWLKKALTGTPHGHDCPECGETFPTDRGMRQHYGQAHEGSIAGHPIECTHCGREERLPECQINHAEQNFCSDECRTGWMQEHGRVQIECDYCATTNYRKRWRVEANNRQFCDHDCYSAWSSEHGPRGPDHHAWKPRVIRECGNCGAEVARRPSHPDASQWFCNEDCYFEWCGDPVLDYGDGWTEEKKEAVRERDNRQCQGCGMSESEHLEWMGCRLAVHHIHRARDLLDADSAVRNGEQNLVAMCFRCHKKWEGIPLRPQ